MSKRITLKKDMIDHIHFNKDSAGPERFVVTIDVNSIEQVRQLQSQLPKENDNYSKLVVLQERLKQAIKENQKAQKSTKNKLDEMDDIQIKDENAEIDVNLYDILEDRLNNLAADEQQLLSLLNGTPEN